MTVDDTDRRILAALTADGRANVGAVADDVGVAPATVTARLDRLERDGVVAGYRPLVDFGAVGYRDAAVLTLTLARGALPAVGERLRALPGIVSAHTVTGPSDLVAVVRHPDGDELVDAVGRVATDPGVRSLSVAGVRRTHAELSPLSL